jgi:hypothetical protein
MLIETEDIHNGLIDFDSSIHGLGFGITSEFRCISGWPEVNDFLIGKNHSNTIRKV